MTAPTTTTAKLARERQVQERRALKQEKKQVVAAARDWGASAGDAQGDGWQPRPVETQG